MKSDEWASKLVSVESQPRLGVLLKAGKGIAKLCPNLAKLIFARKQLSSEVYAMFLLLLNVTSKIFHRLVQRINVDVGEKTTSRITASVRRMVPLIEIPDGQGLEDDIALGPDANDEELVNLKSSSDVIVALENAFCVCLRVVVPLLDRRGKEIELAFEGVRLLVSGENLGSENEGGEN